MVAALLLILGTRAALAAGEYEGTAAPEADKPLPIVFVELKLKDSTTNAWSLTKGAFESVRRAQAETGLEPQDKAALDRLAAAYNDRLSPALRGLRHAVFFTRMDTQILHLALASIGVNSRHGRPSVALDPKVTEVDAKGAPQPVDFKAIEELRAFSLENAEQARDSLKEGLRDLRVAKLEALKPSVMAAYAAMVAAFDASIAVAVQYVEVDAPKGLVSEANRTGQEYFETANKELKPVPEVRRKAVEAFNRATPVIANLEFSLADNAGQARFLHGELDKLGKL